MLHIKQLSAGYGALLVLEGVSLDVREDEIVSLIGPNGAGKSTVLKSIFGLTKIQAGEIHFLQRNLVGANTSDIARQGISYVPQGRSAFPSLNVSENLEMGAFFEKNAAEKKRKFEYVYEKFPRLYERRHQKSKLLSGGEQQMLALGRALMNKPSLLLLDEPSIGLAPKIVAEVFEKIMEIRRDGTSIVMVEQNAVMALQISDRGYVLELGRNKFEGKGRELLSDPRIAEAYLGRR